MFFQVRRYNFEIKRLYHYNKEVDEDGYRSNFWFYLRSTFVNHGVHRDDQVGEQFKCKVKKVLGDDNSKIEKIQECYPIPDFEEITVIESNCELLKDQFEAGWGFKKIS